MDEYVCEFKMGGAVYVIMIGAESEDDASKRVAAMRKSLMLKGKLGGRIPAGETQKPVLKMFTG